MNRGNGMKKRSRYKACVLILALMSCIVFCSTASGAIKYREKDSCFWCGDSDRNILNAYEDGIGVIRLNQWSVSSFPLLLEECHSGNNTTSGGGKGESSVSMSGGYDRQIAEARIYLAENPKPKLQDMATFLCKGCAKNVQEQNEYDVAIIDFESREIIPFVKNRTLFFIKDYAIHMEWDLESKSSNINVLAFYAPIMEQKEKDEELRELE